MRIVHLYKDYFPPTVGGIEQTVERLATWAARHGADVTVLTSHPGSRRTIAETVNGVRVVRCAEWARVWSTPLGPDMPRELARMQADVFHLHYPSPPGELSCLLARPRGAVVMTWHSDVVRQRAVMPVYGRFVHAVLRRADRVMPTFEGQAAASPYLRRYPAKVRVVPLGIDLEKYTREGPDSASVRALRERFGGSPVVLFVGRIVGSKGLDVLLDAAGAVEGRIVVVGDGPELVRLRARCSAMGLDGRVVFTGRVPPDEVRDYIAIAAVGVLPSRYESYGLAMVEIMANGIPVVCTELGTGTTFINRPGETGLAVPPSDAPALAAALNRLLRDEDLRRRLGEGARARAHGHFSTEAMMRGITAVYEEAVEAFAARGRLESAAD